jgi:hypothetical protein
MEKEGDKTREEIHNEVAIATEQIIDAQRQEVTQFIDALIGIVNRQPIIRTDPRIGE